MASTTTIVAVASPPGAGRRGILRLSGPDARRIVAHSCRFEQPTALAARGAWRGRFDDGVGEQPVVVLWMPGPHSYTREDTAELHLVGARALLDAALARLTLLGACPAQPGEFTRRAFESGRIDLTRAEGVLALVEAATEDERRAAAELLFGGLAQRIERLRALLLELRVLCEASLDFDEADTGHVPAAELERLAARALEALDEASAWEVGRARASGVPRIVLAGAPNAGKSTLFNRLVGGAALTSEYAGTTRDALRGHWNVHGVPCELWDTAGLFEGPGPSGAGCDPDRIAQRFARAEHATADLVLWLVDAREQAPEAATHTAPTLVVRSQIDRIDGPAGAPGEVALSALTGAGLDALEAAVAQRVTTPGLHAEARGAVRELTQRHLAALRRAREQCGEARQALGAGAPLDLVAEALRAASDALDEIDGRTAPEDVLEALFARFCIGK